MVTHRSAFESAVEPTDGRTLKPTFDSSKSAFESTHRSTFQPAHRATFQSAFPTTHETAH
jgi:hypothetical protein